MNPFHVNSMFNRSESIFAQDIQHYESQFTKEINQSSFLVIGAAGSIGSSVSEQIFKRNPKRLHLLDINENNLVEVVRNLRSKYGYIDGEFSTYVLDVLSPEFDAFANKYGSFDYILNLAALKHVRSEKDPFTLMRMIKVNIFASLRILELAKTTHSKNFFCVSSDKAADPHNLMGATKRIMELYLSSEVNFKNISMARFANVAYSDGSLLHGFNQRMQLRQPLTAPTDIRRYFITHQEAGELCLLSSLLGRNNEIFTPSESGNLKLTYFHDLAVRHLELSGYEPIVCASEDEARGNVDSFASKGKWPVYFFTSDTTGEKPYEQFSTGTEVVNRERFDAVNVIERTNMVKVEALSRFSDSINEYLENGYWTKECLVQSIKSIVDNLQYEDVGKSLEDRM
ncbi:polysaccharide biosynthesis protein [Planktomarina temperata]|nr:polysaccharide biosynthesis protein [Planktomarina temperata]